MKKTNVVQFVAILALSIFFSACAVFDNLEPRDSVSETYDVKDFDKLDMGSAFHIYVKESSNYSVKVSGDKRDIDDLIVKEVNGKLKIYYNNWFNISRRRVDVEITMPALSEADFSGASVADVAGFKSNKELKINLSGASRGTFDVTAASYIMDISGASNLSINGNPKNVEAEISGASSLNAFDAKTLAADIHLSGASTAKIDVSEKLKVDASGASSVRYRGNPKVESHTSGASKVVKD